MTTRGHLFGLLGTAFAIAVWFMVCFALMFVLLHALFQVRAEDLFEFKHPGFHVAAAVISLVLLLVPFGWMAIAFFQYRHGRQEEFEYLLATVVESDAPLAPALWAYVEDRPHGPWRETWAVFLLMFVVPGYYWLRYRKHSYDAKIQKVAHRLDNGFALSEALREVPGVVRQETLQAVLVGEQTGRLAECLRESPSGSLAGVWVEVVPRFAYPAFLLLMILGVVLYWGHLTAPRLAALNRDFGSFLPEQTQSLIDALPDFGSRQGWNALLYWTGLGTLLLVALLVVCFSSVCWWYLPGIGPLYQMLTQGRVLQLLALAVAANRPLPQAVAILVESRYGTFVVRRRLRALAQRLEQGHPLAPSLRRCGLLTPAMVPLVKAGERVGNLPWVLAELGKARVDRVIRILRLTSKLLSPVILIAVGTLVAYIAVAMFLPLVNVITRYTG